MVSIRDPAPIDEAAWRKLWAGYLTFYQASVSDQVTNHTWNRMLDPTSPIIGRIAESHGELTGFSVSVLHEGSWTLTPICYLEDLFVAPTCRNQGVGQALLDDLIALCAARGWSRLYWHTQSNNATARKLYDRYTPADDFIRYRLMLP